MNCQKGEWAYVVKDGDFPECVGMPVEIIAVGEIDSDGLFCWECKPAWPCRGYDYFTNEVIFDMDTVYYPDAWLRPIRPEADPVTTDCDVGVEA